MIDDEPRREENEGKEADEKGESEEGIDFTDEQLDAISLDESVAVTAGAGTGKTLVLTERYLRALEQPGVSPENILTITFTKKATNEMRERIREEASERLEKAEENGRLDEYEEWREVLDAFEESYIHTIHGFCSRLLREYAVEAPVKPGFEVVEGTERDVLEQEAVEAVLDAPSADGDEAFDSMEKLSEVWSRSEMSDVLGGMVDREAADWAESWTDGGKTGDDYLESLWDMCGLSESDARSVLESDEFQEAVEVVRELSEEDDGLELPDSHKAKKTVDFLTEASEHPGSLGPGTADGREVREVLVLLYKAFEKNSGGLYSGVGYAIGGSGKWSGRKNEYETLRPVAETLFGLVEPYEEDLELVPDEADENAAEYLPHIAAAASEVNSEYEALKQERSALDYDDLIQRSIEFLSSDDETRRRVSDRFEHVMVDEFQDTDPRQWELVKLLTEGAEKDGDGGSDSVFLVGDEKQSIYAFRGADVTAFGRARDELEGEELPLSGNFRTLDIPLRFMNEVFGGDGDAVFDPLGGGRSEYEARPQDLSMERDRAEDVSGLEGSVEYHVVPTDGEEEAMEGLEPPEGFEDPESSSEREAEAVAAKIGNFLSSGKRVYDEDEKRVRKVRAEDVAILLRRRTNLKKYERALEDRDIPYTVVSGIGFYDTPEVRNLTNLLSALVDPEDDVSLYGVLRSPVFGFTDDDIATVAEGGDIWESLAEAEGKPREAYERMLRWRAAAGLNDVNGTDGEEHETVGWDRVVSQVIEETGYVASLSAGERGSQARANVEKFRQQLRSWTESGVRTPSEILRRLELQQEGEDMGEATIPEGTEGVRILTIHSSKGLEFPVVVIPDLSGGINFDSSIASKVIIGEPASGEGIVAGMKAPGESRYSKKKNLAWRRIEEEKKMKTRAEEKRVLYVACTRARDHLVLCSGHDIEEGEDGFVFEEPEEPEEAKSWRDWVQPILLGEGVAEDLSRDGVDSVTTTLNGVPYTVSLPTAAPDAEEEDASDADPQPPRMDVSEAPEATRHSLYATQLVEATGADGRHEEHEPEPGSVLEREAEVELYAGDGDAGMGGAQSEKIATDAVEGENGVEELPPEVFGTVVHKLCELRPPEDERRSYVKKAVSSMGNEPSEDEVSEMLEHVERGIEFSEEVSEDATSVHKEMYVTADLDEPNAWVSGEIDFLVVEDDEYHVVDYKTNSMSGTSPDELLEHYRPQLLTYAAALKQNDADMAVKATLFFTETGEKRSVRFGSRDKVVSELASMVEESV